MDQVILLLFLVSTEPYLFNELFASSRSSNLSVSGPCSCGLAATFFILRFFTNSLVDEEKQLTPKHLLRRWKLEGNVTPLAALKFVVSLVPYFGETNVCLASTASPSHGVSLRSLVRVPAPVVGWGGRAVASTAAH